MVCIFGHDHPLQYAMNSSNLAGGNQSILNRHRTRSFSTLVQVVIRHVLPDSIVFPVQVGRGVAQSLLRAVHLVLYRQPEIP